jgi:hypothetical protein
MATAPQTAITILPVPPIITATATAIPLVLQVQLALSLARQVPQAAAPPTVIRMEVATVTGAVGNVSFFGSSLRDKIAIIQLRQCSQHSASPSRKGS